MFSSLFVVVLRQLAVAAGTALAAHGVIAGGEIETVTGALVTLGSLAYHAWQHYKGQSETPKA